MTRKASMSDNPEPVTLTPAEWAAVKLAHPEAIAPEGVKPGALRVTTYRDGSPSGLQVAESGLAALYVHAGWSSADEADALANVALEPDQYDTPAGIADPRHRAISDAANAERIYIDTGGQGWDATRLVIFPLVRLPVPVEVTR